VSRLYKKEGNKYILSWIPQEVNRSRTLL